VFGACFLTTRNQKRETRNSIPQRSESAITAETFMSNEGKFVILHGCFFEV